jgi:hypothetical protein
MNAVPADVSVITVSSSIIIHVGDVGVEASDDDHRALNGARRATAAMLMQLSRRLKCDPRVKIRCLEVPPDAQSVSNCT